MIRGTSTLELPRTKELSCILGGRVEVNAPYNLGRIDILSNEWLVESKKGGSTSEKNALGQLLVYSYAMKWKHNLGLAIIGEKYPHHGIRRFCKDHSITIFYYNKNTCKWSLLDDNR